MNPGLGWARPDFRFLVLVSRCPLWGSSFQVPGSRFKVTGSRVDFQAPGTLLGGGPILDPIFRENDAKSFDLTLFGSQGGFSA